MERSHTETEAKTLGTAKIRGGTKRTHLGTTKTNSGTAKGSIGRTRAKPRGKILSGSVRTKSAFTQKTSCT